MSFISNTSNSAYVSLKNMLLIKYIINIKKNPFLQFVHIICPHYKNIIQCFQAIPFDIAITHNKKGNTCFFFNRMIENQS